MSRGAVKRIGLDNLEKMNAGIDIVPIAKAIEDQPKNINVWDEKGYTNYFIKKQHTTVRKNARYSF